MKSRQLFKGNKPLVLFTSLIIGLSLFTGVRSAYSQDKEITLCWAAWEPAVALEKLSREFTSETGIKIKFEFVPWTDFTDRVLGKIVTGEKKYDLLIGDSQWMGKAVTTGLYVKLNDFFTKNNISVKNFLPAAVENYSTWPKGTPNYWALPAMGDAVGWVYRKDWFSRPELKKEFKATYGYELAPAKTWNQLYDIGKFFQGRVIDGKKVYGMAIYTERGAEGITMGVTSAMYAWGMNYSNPKKPYAMDGFINGPEAVSALEFYKKLYKECTPPGHSNAYMTEDLESYQAGQVALEMNFFAFFPSITKDQRVGGEKSGFFVNPSQKISASTLGGQGISVLQSSSNKALALEYIKWFARPDVQKKWWKLGGYSCERSVLSDSTFSSSTPFASAFLKAMNNVKDFWQEPTYAELLQCMQKRLHEYVVGDQGTAKQALDNLLEDWKVIFKKDGKL